MAIPTREALSGFIATDPQLTETSNGGHRFYARVGIEQFQRNEDGSFTQLESEFTNLVMFDKAAQRAAEKFQKGDNFIAEGYTREVNYERNGQAVETEEFVAKRIGHDAARTRYEVDRSPRNQVAREAAAYEPPQRSTPTAQASSVSM